jgi:hypothetical protein
MIPAPASMELAINRICNLMEMVTKENVDTIKAYEQLRHSIEHMDQTLSDNVLLNEYIKNNLRETNQSIGELVTGLRSLEKTIYNLKKDVE